MRYEAELSLRFVGDRAECQKYIAEARTVLGEVWNRDIVLGGLEQSWRRVKIDERATVLVYATKYITPIITIIVEPVEGSSSAITAPADLRLVWMPEGIIFTPVSEEYTEGWGLPTRHHVTGAVFPFSDPETGDPLHPIGTAGGIWPQVMLNKFINNKYLDDAAYITGVDETIVPTLVQSNPLLRESWDTPYNIDGLTRCNSWQILYNPLDCVAGPATQYWDTIGNDSYAQVPGVYDTSRYADGVLTASQFSGYLVNDLIFEPPSNEWHAHRAEELLYYTPAQEAIFQHTNALRTALGRGKMHRIVRGHANTARLSVSEVALSGKQFHDSAEYFRPGYGYVSGRSRSARGEGTADGENLLITTDVGLDWQAGVDVATSWENSPPHYENMTHTRWTETEDVPGAEHFIGFLAATVDETVAAGALPDPVSGVEWAQLFSLSETWVPVPSSYQLSESGSVGNFGKTNRYERGGYYGTDYLFVSYRQVLYAISNDLFAADDGMGVFGASEYVEEITGQRRLRAIVATSDYMLDPPPGQIHDYEEFTLYVITTPLASTGDCDWEIETQISYLFNDGWIPALEGQIKFSPNGKKFVFTMLFRGSAYTEALDYDATDFTTEFSALLNPRRSVELHHIIFNADRLAGDWFSVEAQTPLRALVDCGTSGTPFVDLQHFYRRTLVGEINAFPDWDDNNELIYIKLVMDERSDQLYTYAQSQNTHNFMYTVRKMVFPSGKEIVYHQQYMTDVKTVEDQVEVVANGWAEGDGTADPFFLMFHYINTRDEDVVYTRRETRLRLAIRTGRLYPTTYEYGTLSIHADCGWDGVDPDTSELTNVRHQETLYAEPAGFFNDYEAAVGGASEFVSGEGWTGLSMKNSNRVYQTDIVVPAARTYVVFFPPVTYIYIRQFLSVPHPGVSVATDGSPEDVWVRLGYNGYANKTVDSLIGRPPFASYDVSVIYGIQQRPWFPAVEYMGTNHFWGSSIWNDSFMPANVAPVIHPEYVSKCQVVRYQERIMIRLENRKWPWATVKDFTLIGTAPGLPTPIVAAGDTVGRKPDWDTVPEAAQLLLWANFDIDEAAGMSDVTDIQPFGRVG